MKSLDIKKLKYNYRKIVDKEMNDFLKDERSSYLKFLKSFPLYVMCFCILLILFEIAVTYNFNVNFEDLEILMWELEELNKQNPKNGSNSWDL